MLLQKFVGVLLPAGLCAVCSVCAASLPPRGPLPSAVDAQAVQAFAALPDWFEPQRPGVFVSHGHAPAVAVEPRGIRMSLPAAAGQPDRVLPVSLPGAHRLRWNGDRKLPGVTSYFTGSDRSRWRTGVPQFAAVRAASVWPGVDMVIYSHSRRMEYDFVLAPGSDLRRVRLQFGRGWRASVDAAGDLQVTDGTVTFRQQKPVAWQQRAGRRVELVSAFRLQRDGSVGFLVPGYDPARELVIDPVLAFSSYIGGDTVDSVYGVVAVPGGYWLTGSTGSTLTLPTRITPYQILRDAYIDVFLAMITINADGAPTLAYYTYIGGSDNDIPAGIAVSPSGTLAVVGSTYSKDFPVTSTTAFQTTWGGAWNAFVLLFNPSLASTSQLVYASYYGGASNVYGSAVAFDPSGNIIAAGTTPDTALVETPVNAAYQASTGGAQDVFILRVDPSASTPADTLVNGTLLGGNLTDIPYAIGVDAQGRIYIVGTTASANFPVSAAPYQRYLSSYQNAFFSVIDFSQPTADQLVYSTYLGGENLDEATSLVLDAQNRAWLAGYTNSTRFPITSDAVQTTFSGEVAAWLARVDITQSGAGVLTYSTYFNGSQTTVPFAVTLDSLGRPTIGGYTTSTDLPIVAPLSIQSTPQLQGAFLATFDPTRSGSAGLVFSTVFGGTTLNTVTSLTRDALGNLLVGGYTNSADFPVTNGAARLSPAGSNVGFYMLLKPASTLHRGPRIPERPVPTLPGTERFLPPDRSPTPSKPSLSITSASSD